ncbi:uncharacterized protein ARMOST_22245 [Armillaria ostoyae]|uniref:Uncharacterized protein n=1 Tax=Armillaria ostoyae TaxID=47428 RepID=A0A284SCB3_ARMOS|nr:uncharacterized protein ARMOST_22245 [Armillaria ostoyae]
MYHKSGDKMIYGDQDDIIVCGFLAVNTMIAHEIFDDEVWTPKHKLRDRVCWFNRPAEAHLKGVYLVDCLNNRPNELAQISSQENYLNPASIPVIPENSPLAEMDTPSLPSRIVAISDLLNPGDSSIVQGASADEGDRNLSEKSIVSMANSDAEAKRTEETSLEAGDQRSMILTKTTNLLRNE